jgi:lysophospholipase L1-like esterase
MKTFLCVPLILAAVLSRVPTARADFALRDGDTVAFLGDSITAPGIYQETIENYVLLRFPRRTVRFINAGKAGSTASESLERIDRDVFQRGATVLVVALGINDINWGFQADAEHKQQYLDAIKRIIALCLRRNIRVFICSAAVTAEDPQQSEAGFLQTMSDEVLGLARSMGAGAIDAQRGMREVQKAIWASNQAETDPCKRTTLHEADGIHLNDLGYLAMAFTILKGLGAPAEVSSVRIDAKVPKVLSAEGCGVSGLRGNAEQIEFDRLDQGWPINFGSFGAFNFRFIPITDELNRYLLSVLNLPAGRYAIFASGRNLGEFTDKVLAGGLNISSLTANNWEPGGPWEAQSGVLMKITEARRELAGAQQQSESFTRSHPRYTELRAQSQRVVDSIASLQRNVARPYPIHFIIRRVAER